ncbi:MAG TPA: hypothetical protein VGG10_00440 [Rhizomicrobium sp.]|jgi:hypothetical protein
MAKPVESIVKAILGKNGREAKLLAAIEYGWARWKVHPDHLKFRRGCTRASLVWEATVEKGIELFAGDDGVRASEEHDTVTLIFDGTVLLRFKKADAKLYTRNYPTLLAELFHKTEPNLFGFPDEQRVEAVYVLNQYQTEIVWSGIVARDGSDVIWSFEFSAPKPMKLRPEAEKKSTATLAKVKKPAEEKNDKKSSGGN